jgi:hypothetical protein
MSASFEQVNYSVRPGKNIERKMFCDTFAKLENFQKVECYRYIGLGSTFFTDFALFHRRLGIIKNLSMERDISKKERFLFNLPYKCIDLRFEDSNSLLPALKWDSKTITWLDYDETLDQNKLEDVACVAGNSLSGSIVIVSADATPDKFGLLGSRLRNLRNILGREKMPLGINEAMLGEWGTAAAYRSIIHNEIVAAVEARNGAAWYARQRFSYQQLFNFRYRDGSAAMCTVGGILYQAKDKPKFDACEFDKLQFFRAGDESFNIDVPILTLKEMRFLDAQLPRTNKTRLRAPAIPKKAVEDYAKLYKYFPAYVDADVG